MRKFIAFLYLAVFLAGVVSVLLSGAPPDLSGGRPENRDPTLRERLGHAARDERAKAKTPIFYPPGHFHTGPITVSIASLWPDARIYYTTDGSEPTENSAPYGQPLALGTDAGTKCVVVKAVAISDGRTSSVAAHSYFFDPDIKNRFTSYVFSLSTNEANLYDHEYGILVPGKRRADAVTLHPDGAADAHDANYKGRGRDWERPVYVEAFSPEGKRIVSQGAGVRVFGAGSRHYAQKSLRLTARKFYEPKAGKFNYPFFPEVALASAKNPSPMLSWDSLILSNGGDDPNNAQIRTSLVSRIAAEAGYPYVAPMSSAAVFLNGKYYGHAFLTTRVDDSFLAELYDAPKSDFIILAGGVKQLIPFLIQK
jgi:hypothetical protein